MRWRVSLGAVTILLGCLSIMLNRTWIERILTALLLAIPIGSLIHTIWPWKKHPLVDEEVDRELKEEQKSVFDCLRKHVAPLLLHHPVHYPCCPRILILAFPR